MAHTGPDGWTKRPGNWDALRTVPHWPSSNPWGFPDLLPCRWIPPHDTPLVAYTTRHDNGRLLSEGIAHFFLDDYRFEAVWNRPRRTIERVKRFRASLAPDFSLYHDWPLAAQLWNTYRARVVVRTWQASGLIVITVVNWGMPESWEWCFAGIQRGGTVALSVPDLRPRATRFLFESGLIEMVDQLAPQLILSYGRLDYDVGHTKVREYVPDWLTLRTLAAPRRQKPTRGSVGAAPLSPHLQPLPVFCRS